MRAKRRRLFCASVAYLLLQALRRLGLVGTELARAQCHRVRFTLLRDGAHVRVTTRKIRIALARGVRSPRCSPRCMPRCRAADARSAVLLAPVAHRRGRSPPSPPGPACAPNDYRSRGTDSRRARPHVPHAPDRDPRAPQLSPTPCSSRPPPFVRYWGERSPPLSRVPESGG